MLRPASIGSGSKERMRQKELQVLGLDLEFEFHFLWGLGDFRHESSRCWIGCMRATLSRRLHATGPDETL